MDKLYFVPWMIFVAAALLEVGGDAFIRKGLKGTQYQWMVLGFILLGSYGFVVNMITTWDFSKLLGMYVAVFAIVSVLVGKFAFQETTPAATWLGLALIAAGGMVIQFGHS